MRSYSALTGAICGAANPRPVHLHDCSFVLNDDSRLTAWSGAASRLLSTPQLDNFSNISSVVQSDRNYPPDRSFLVFIPTSD